MNMDFAGKFNGILMLLLAIVIGFAAWSSLMPEAQSAAKEFTQNDTCADAGCLYNASGANISVGITCYNLTNKTQACAYDFDYVPFGGLFSKTGVVMLAMMVGLFILVIRGVLKKTG